jgi:phage gpG-like protein
MISVEVDSTAVRLKLDAMPESIRSGVRQTVSVLAEKLRSHIVQDKLRGQVLNRRTGLLGDSEAWRVDDTAQGITGTVYVGKNVPYAAIHEYGAVFSRLVTMAWGKHVKNPKNVTFHYPERSFQRTGLADMREEIVTSLRDAVMRAAQL